MQVMQASAVEDEEIRLLEEEQLRQQKVGAAQHEEPVPAYWILFVGAGLLHQLAL